MFLVERPTPTTHTAGLKRGTATSSSTRPGTTSTILAYRSIEQIAKKFVNVYSDESVSCSSIKSVVRERRSSSESIERSSASVLTHLCTSAMIFCCFMLSSFSIFCNLHFWRLAVPSQPVALAVGVAKVAEPQFEGQTKTKLGNTEVIRLEAGGFPPGSSSPGGSHPRALTEPCVTVSRYTAPVVLIISGLVTCAQ